LGVDICHRPCARNYVASFDEFALLEEMAGMGLMEYTRTVLD